MPRRRLPLIVLASLVVSVSIGLAAGIGGFTFAYAKGAAYMKDDPAACMNCHVMREQFDGWVKSSHRSVAVCNDCHTPKGFIPKYFTKALNGWHHSSAFTTGNFVEPIRIGPRNRDITEASCRNCHQAIVGAIDAHGEQGGESMSCVRCHPNVGHLH
jgi:cytochrome c nitrite reductase small subunit